jgi:hypothetical protein
MKYMLLAVCTTASLLLLSSCKDSEDTEDDPDISLDTYVCSFPQSSTVEMHSVSLKADTILGRGYDVMGNFLAATNMKRCVVNVPDSEIVRFGYLKSDANAYIGTDANSYLQNIMYDNGFSQDESSKENKWFTGTIKDYYKNPLDYATAYSFAGKDVFFTQTIMKANLKSDIKYILKNRLTTQFKNDLNSLTASQLIDKYGTHVLCTAYIGMRLRGMVNCVVAESNEDAAKDAFCRLSAQMKETVGSSNLEVLNNSKAARCYGGTLHVNFNGGDISKVTFTTDGARVTAQYSHWWNNENIDLNHFALTELHKDDLIPLYEFIADENKKEAVKEATNQYIADNQLKEPEMLPLFQAFMGPHHKYVTSYDDAQKTSGCGGSDTEKCKSPLGLIYKTQQSGTVPLYRYSNAKNDRLSTSASIDDAGDYQPNGIVGYVYAAPMESAAVIAVYELWNGSHDYACTTENLESYDSKQTWKKTGNVFYLVKP